jgi:hypothetical protein
LQRLTVYKNRSNRIQVDMKEDVSGMTLTAEIRTQPSHLSPLLATWTVSFVTDGTDGLVELYLSDTITAQIEADTGYTDIKKVISGEPYPGFERPLEVFFQGTVTA